MKDFEKIDKKIEYSLFSPKKQRSLFYDYPELKENPDLIHLKTNKRKLLFCYYLGCDTSPLKPFFMGDDVEKKSIAIHKALEHSGLIDVIDEDAVLEYVDGNFPPDVNKGVNGFLIYKVNARIRMKQQMEKMLENWEIIINKNVDSKEFDAVDKNGASTGEKDFDKIKKYTDITINIKKQMSETLKELEYGFGLTESEKMGSENDDISFTDLKHEGTL